MNRIAMLIPARNARPHVGRLLQSAAAQTSPFDEIWLFDDASDDGTGELARASGVRVVRSDVHVGPSAGKNRLAEATSCEWVHFHDADDALEPEFVSRARSWMDGDETDVVLFATDDRDDQTGEAVGRRAWDDGALRRDAVAYAVTHAITNCGVYRRGRFLEAGGFVAGSRFRYSEDQAMHVNLALAGLRFRAEPYPGVVIHRRSGSMSSGHPIECARSQVELLKMVTDRTGSRYRAEVGARAWRLAGVCAGFSDRTYVQESLGVARRVGYRIPREEHWVIRLIGSVAPRAAVYGREWMIRTFKSHLREGLPVASDVPTGAGTSGVA